MTQLVTISDPRSPEAEAYRSLRTNLTFSGSDGLPTSLVVSSPGPDEGKTMVLANLAVVLAKSERRVIAVDCDLRRPSLHELFDLENDIGVAQVLTGEVDEGLPLQDTAIEGLRASFLVGAVPRQSGGAAGGGQNGRDGW